jgi:glutamate synthase (NADPH/NADH) small chain
MGRMSFAYPNAPRDLMEKGKLDPQQVCVACSACTQIMRDGGKSGCVPRDAEVYEPIYKAGRAEALDTIQEMAKTCRQCNDPTCVSHCPAQVNIPKFVDEIAAGKFRDAYETIRKANVLAAVCGYVCPSETLCESACINQHYTQTVPIRHLQRWVSRKAVEEGWAAEPRPHGGRSGKRVAVLGAGPAGISAAVRLAAYGHAVALIERASKPGGMAQETIPPDRLPDPIIDAEIRAALASAGDLIERRTGTLGETCTLDSLQVEGFDGVLIAFGLGAAAPLPDTPRPSEGVLGALEFLETAKIGGGDLGGKTVLVLGAGNTAIDAALTAKRLGAADVSIVYRRSFAEMPAWPEERDHAVRAGVNFLILTAPVAYQADAAGKLTGLEVVRTKMGAPGADGRRQPHEIPGTAHVLPADMAVEALGQRVEEGLRAALPGVEFTASGRVRTADGNLATTRPGVFAAGDIVNGGTTVVQAVAEGARAAREIHQYLRG